jgi:hypothetical protein
VAGEFGGGAVVGPNRNRLIVSGEDDRCWPIVVNVGIMGITDAKQIGGNSKGNLLALINECNPLTRCDVNGAVEAVDNVEGPDWRIDENL